MRKDKVQSKKVIKRVLIGFIALLLVMIIGFYVYTLDYYRASDYVEGVISGSDLTIETKKRVTTIFPSSESDLQTGFIFYPGGKVEARAYMPLLLQLADKGLTCILIEMPMNLAVFDIKAADDIYELYPQINQWYLGGHSLGGAMVSSYVEENYDKIEGLILMGAYPINEAEVDTLVLYGSEDLGLDLSKLVDTENKLEIIGGNHAWFGDYGQQDGDGTAVINHKEQQTIAVDAIMAFIESKE